MKTTEGGRRYPQGMRRCFVRATLADNHGDASYRINASFGCETCRGNNQPIRPCV